MTTLTSKPLVLAVEAELALPGSLLALPYAGAAPTFAGAPVHAGEGAAVLGRVTVGSGAWLGALSVMRADGDVVKIGDDLRLGPRSTVHIMHELYPAIVGDRVAVGANACVHACTVGNDCIIGDGAVVLDDAVVEDEVIIEPGSIVFPRKRLARGQVYAGSPAKPVRPVRPGEIAERRAKMLQVADEETRAAGARAQSEIDPSAFVAATASLKGRVRMQAGASVWYGCEFDAGDAFISIGANSNVQDNTLIRCSTAQGVTIGRDSVIGHNVVIKDCVIGNEALVGIGSTVETGTVIQDRALLAAGARTAPGQVLESGWVWGGSPVRRIAPFDKQELIAFTIATYKEYARNFKAAQEAQR